MDIVNPGYLGDLKSFSADYQPDDRSDIHRLADERPESAPRGHLSPWALVPWRTIIGAVLVVAGFIALVVCINATRRIVLWMFIAGFFAIVFAPSVRRVERRVGGHRGLATAIVMFTAALTFFGLIALFLLPLRSQVIRTVTDLPGTVKAAGDGRGPIGHLVTRLNLNKLVQDHEKQLTTWANDATKAGVDIARIVLQGILAFVTIFVMAFLMLTQSSAMGENLLPLIPRRRRAAAQRVAVDAASAVSGYMIGNFLISLVAGVAAFICLLVLGVPNPAVYALWVAFADLIPLVGATLGAAVAVLAAFFHGTTAGVVALIFFILYQQFENSVLQMAVMSRTVKVNPLMVLLSVLIGVELFGIVGALLAIPLAGTIQVFVKEVWRETRRDRLVLPEDGASLLLPG